MRRALIAFSVLLLIPVAVVTALSHFDFSVRIGEAPPRTVNTLLAIHYACALVAIGWLGISVRRTWGHIRSDVRSGLGALCVVFAAVSVLAWAWYLVLIPMAGLWYDLP